MSGTVKAFLGVVDQFETAHTARRGRAEAEASLGLVRALVARLPHKYLLAASKEEIQAAGRTLASEGRTREEMKGLQLALVGLLDHAFQTGVLAYHAVRELGDRRARRVPVPNGALASGLDPTVAAMLEERLPRSGVEPIVEPSPVRALDRAGWFPFRFVLCGFPLANLQAGAFLETLRGEASLCRSAGLVLVTTAENREKAEWYVGRGANRVVEADRLGDQLAGILAELGTVSRRTGLRVMVRAVLDAEERVEVWQSENVSSSGMLVRRPKPLPGGREMDLEFTLPGSTRSIRVRARAVRSTAGGHEKVAGLGLRFLSFEGDGEYRLELFLKNPAK